MPTRRATRREPCQVGALAVVAAAATLFLVAATGESKSFQRDALQPARWSGLVGGERAHVPFGQRLLVVLKAPSLADFVTRAGGRASDVQERRWTKQALERQRALLSRLALQGVRIRPDFTYTRVLNGFAAAVDPRAVSLLDRAPEVAGVYAVRATYPAATGTIRREAPAVHGPPYPAGTVLPGFTGRGVTIAVLDTGVDRSHLYLGGRVRRGFDVVDGDRLALAEANPDDRSQVERHGTEVAGVLAGASDDGRALGVATAATVLPIRVAGWQRDATGEWAMYGRSDQLIAGLERAVDPNGDGAAHDAARIALVGVVEPFAAFASSPTARAVDGATRLDTLVVVPAGNEGGAGRAYGRIAGPGGAARALTVGAADLRSVTQDVRLVVRAGLTIRVNRVVPLAGANAPQGVLTLPLAAPRPRAAGAPGPAASGAGVALADFFDTNGFSLVAGKAALVPAGSSPGLAVETAARAGAHAVLLYGGPLPAGGLGLPESVSIPVVAVPEAAAREALAAVRGDADAVASLGAVGSRRNEAGGRVAAFSSQGLAFDARVKPELVAPGVAVGTAEPGTTEEGVPRSGTINGTSAAAATVAGAAALLAQARPELGASALKGLLVGSATPLAADGVAAQGAGLVNVGAAAASEVVPEPAALALEPVRSRRSVRAATVEIRNVSTRALPIETGIEFAGDAQRARVSVSPRRATVPRGGSVTLRVIATGRGRGPSYREGFVRIAPRSGRAQRVPWAVAFASAEPPLLTGITLRPAAFRPSDTGPAVLSFQAGRILGSDAGEEVRPVERLDIVVATAAGKKLGVLARLRDLLPGRLAFALTGRGPGGQILGKGRYRLRLVAVPPGGGRPTRRTVAFTIR